MADQVAAALRELHPEVAFEIICKANNGERIEHLRARMDRDVMPLRPDAVVLYWGSDCNVKESLMTTEQIKILRANFERNVRYVLQTLLSYGAHVIMTGPTLLGERPHGQNQDDGKVDAYRRMNKRIAAEVGVEYIDTRAAFFAAIPQGGIVCGLPIIPMMQRMRLNPLYKFGVLYSCWLSAWVAQGLTLFGTSRNKLLGMGTRDMGVVTRDGEHHNARGAAIVAKLFTEALDRWLKNRKPTATLILNRWSNELGDLSLSNESFPDPQRMLSLLHILRFRLVLSITPFCSPKSTSFTSWISDQIYLPWNSTLAQEGNFRGSSSRSLLLLNAFNPTAVQWFADRLREFKERLSIDGFSFSLGEDFLFQNVGSPSTEIRSTLEWMSANAYLPAYAAVSTYAGLGHTYCYSAAAILPRGLSNILLYDLSPVCWGTANGLATIITKSLHISTFYQGTTYGGALSTDSADHSEVTEMFIRWLQANALLPMQFRMLPWNRTVQSALTESASGINSPISSMDDTVFDAYSKVLSLRYFLRGILSTALEDAKVNGLGVVRPIWASDSHCSFPSQSPTMRNNVNWTSTLEKGNVSELITSMDIYGVQDQYMVGEHVMIAPVMTSGAIQRMYVIPAGPWMPCNGSLDEIVYGPKIEIANVYLSTLICYVKVC